MKIKMMLSLCVFFLFSASLKSQIWGQKPILSPEIKDDNRITFRLFAPDAQKVEMSGNWMPGWGTKVAMLRNDTGMYELTIDPLPSEIYTYAYFVDGVKTNDPYNASVVRDGTRNESMFIVPGEKGTLYGVNDVPHG